MNENKKYGTLISKLMADRITVDEEKELDEWICSKKENMKLFERLINDYKRDWAKKWFAQAGVSTRGIKWKKVEGWYKEDKNLWDFYLVMAVMFLFLALVYFLLE